MKWHNFLFLATGSFNVGTCAPLQVAMIFKLSKILFTITGLFDCSDQYFIATSANWMDLAGPNSSSLIFSFFISSNMPRSFAGLFSLPDLSCFSASGTRKLMPLSNTSFDALQISIFAAFLLSFFGGGGPQLHSSSTDGSVSHWEALTVKSVRYPLSFSFHDLPKGLFAELNFSKELPNLKITFSVATNLVSRLRSRPVTPTDIAGAGFILTIPDAEEIAVVVIIVEGVRVTKVLLLVIRTVA